MDLTIILLIALCLLLFLFFGLPYIRRKTNIIRVYTPIRDMYIKQTKKMIEDYNIKKEELYNE